MKRTLTLALGAVLTASAVPAFSQDNFPDVPDNHWAWQALKNMKDAGLLVGYPDGLFRGARPASRYELAVAIHATYQHLKGLIDGLQAQQKALQDKVDSMSTEGFATKDELRQVRDALATVSAAVDGMKSWGDDISALKKMSSTFEKELASMGVDVEAMKKGLQELMDRVGALEKRKLPVDIHGTANLLALGGYSRDERFGKDVTGRPLGVGRGDNFGNPAGATEDLSIVHEATLALTGTNDTGPKWKLAVATGNLFGSSSNGDGFSDGMFGNMSALMPGTSYREVDGDFWVPEFSVAMDTSLWGHNFTAKMGRVGFQAGNMFFQRPNTTPYFSSEYWDNGNWIFDGGIFTFQFGSANLNVFGGRQSDRHSVNGVDINPMWAGQVGHVWSRDFGDPRPAGFANGALMIDQHLGFNLNVPLSNKGSLVLNYIKLDSNNLTPIGGSPIMLVNRVMVFGGEINFNLGEKMKINAGYSKSNMGYNHHTELDEDNSATWARLNWSASDKWGLHFGYRKIEPQFNAPGSWGRFGDYWNPTGFQGGMVGGWFNLNDRASLHASSAFYRGTDTDIDGIVGFGDEDKVNILKVGLDYKLNESWDMMIGGEWVRWNLEDDVSDGFNGGNPSDTFFRLGLKYKVSGNAWWSFLWESTNYDGDGVSGWGPFGFSTEGNGSSQKATGGLISTQFGIKF